MLEAAAAKIARVVVGQIRDFDAAFFENTCVFGFAPEMEFSFGDWFGRGGERSFEVRDRDVVVAKELENTRKRIGQVVFVLGHHLIEWRDVDAVFNAATKRAITDRADGDRDGRWFGGSDCRRDWRGGLSRAARYRRCRNGWCVRFVLATEQEQADEDEEAQ